MCAASMSGKRERRDCDAPVTAVAGGVNSGGTSGVALPLAVSGGFGGTVGDCALGDAVAAP